ncbi:MAG: DNA alkylation repair protein [Pseudomonadota bacterium]
MTAPEVAPLALDASAQQVLAALKRLESPADRAGMARFGIAVERALGISVATLRRLGRRLKGRHGLALELWDSGIHEARILATIIGDPGKLDQATAARWVGEVDSWDLCDQLCMGLVRRCDFAWDAAFLWCLDERVFVKRAGFALIATLAVHDKAASEARFRSCLKEIERAAGDERNFVKKAVNWALRQIGKRSKALHDAALELAGRLAAREDAAARWIGRNVLRELESQKVLARLA